MPLGTGIAKGMGLTLARLFSRSITVQYPTERYDVPERSRQTLELTRHEDGRLKCRACMLCVKACPDDLIDIPTSTDKEGRTIIDSWTWESCACMLCALCVEACPFDALRTGRDYENAVYVFERLLRTMASDEVADKPAKKKKEADADKGADTEAGAKKEADSESQDGDGS